MTKANQPPLSARPHRFVPLAAAALAAGLAAYAVFTGPAPRASAADAPKGEAKADAPKPHDLLQSANTPGGSYGEVAKGAPTPVNFKKITLSRDFTCEGSAVGDFNHDGHNDVVAGPYWYEGPDFSADKKHEIYAPKTFKPDNDYSDNFVTYAYDFNGDGWADVLVIGFPGKEAFWYENPKNEKSGDENAGHWKKHLAYDNVDDESPGFWDILGNGNPCLVCASHGHWGYAQPDPKDPEKPWKWHNVSPEVKGLQKFTHGIGVGDVNGDGKPDLLEKDGWWEQPASLEGDPEWKFHPVKFYDKDGSAQMYTFDVNGDGKPDVITSLDAHGYGLAWFEQKADGTFEKHKITGSKAEENPEGVHFSQLHAVALADVNGDGLPDIVTGKRHFAHGSHGDVEPLAPSVLYWFELVRKDGKAEFVPHLVDEDSGVGTQVTVGNLGPSNKPGIVVGNKNGTFVFVQDAAK